MNSLTLSQLNDIVKQSIELSLPDSFWVQAELASIRENRGHCYMELIEKAEPSDSLGSRRIVSSENTVIAQAKACCWKNTWLRIGPNFERETGRPLHAGMKVLLSVKANFHVAFGFSWIVNDIDATFTIGDMARRRQEIINTLKDEGIIDLNKQLPISPFCKRIAVISSATAAGYGDFCNQLLNNDYGFKFSTRLFPAIMQGEQVENTIIAALDNIYKIKELFDCVVIIRGGGSTTDLSGFDTLALAENVANFPLPVITGIGHDRDQSVLDIVAAISAKTPTAVAAFLIDNLAHTLEQLEEYSLYLNNFYTIKMTREENKLNEYHNKLSLLIDQFFLIERNKLMLIEQKANAADPINILKKGYSVTLFEGSSVKDSSTLTAGDKVSIMLAKGVVNATVS